MAAPVTDPDLIAKLEKSAARPVDDATAAELDRLARVAAVPGSPAPTQAEAGARGFGQGLSAGYGDEMAGARRGAAASTPARLALGLIPFLGPALTPAAEDVVAVEKARQQGRDPSFGEAYTEARDADRAANAAAQEAFPKTYLGTEITGAIASSMVPGGQAANVARGGRAAQFLSGLGRLAGQGALQGAGYSDGDTPGEVASDTGVGSLVGLGGGALGKVFGRLGPWLTSKGRSLAARGTQRAAQQAAEESTAAVRSVEAAARERAANAYRQMERIELALQNPALPPAERAAIEAFKKTPEYADLVAANAKGVLAAAPDALAEREAAAAIAQAERAALPQAIATREKELLTPQPGADLKSYLKRYAEPVVWGIAGQQLGNAMGMDPRDQVITGTILGAIGNRTRAGKALYDRLNRPAHQVPIGRALEGAGKVGNATVSSPLVQRLLAAGVPAAVIASIVGDEEPTP